MSSNRNPFAHLIPQTNSGIVGLEDDDSDIDYWKNRGKSQADRNRKIYANAGNPNPIQSETPQNAPMQNQNPFSHLIPKNAGMTNQAATNQAPENMPTWLKALLKLPVELGRPDREAIPERLAATGRGFHNVGKGLKQLYLEAFGGQNEAADYTRQQEAETKSWEKTPAGKNPFNQIYTSGAEATPGLLPIGGVAGMAGKGLLKQMLAGAAGTGALAGTQYVPPGEDRGANVLEGATVGALVPAAFTLPKIAKTLIKKVDPKGWVSGIQKTHDVAQAQASDIFNFVKDEAKQRGVSKVDIEPGVIDEAASTLAKTRSNKKLIEDAKSGDYDALHSLQADLGKTARQNISSDSYADRNLGFEMLDTRDKINESIRDRFKEYGHEDLAKLLDAASDKWKKLKQTYYEHPTIAKMVSPKSRKVPKNIEAALSEESVPMQKLLDAHPEIAEGLKLTSEKKKIMKVLKLGLSATGLGGTGSLLGKSNSGNNYQGNSND